MKCSECVHWGVEDYYDEERNGILFRGCDRLLFGPDREREPDRTEFNASLTPRDFYTTDPEGSGCIGISTGPEFGCVLFEKKSADDGERAKR